MNTLPDGPWSVAQGTYDGHVIIARINTGARRLAGDHLLRHRLGVAVRLREADNQGLPTPEEGASLNEIEDAFCDALRVGSESVHVLTISTSGMREFVFHTSTLDAARLAIPTVLPRFATHEIQWIEADDPEWDVFLQFADQLN